MDEEGFKSIYSRFFPQGGECWAPPRPACLQRFKFTESLLLAVLASELLAVLASELLVVLASELLAVLLASYQLCWLASYELC